MTYNPILHNRRSIRLKQYDYSLEGLYFITLCVENRRRLFGEIHEDKMHLNEFGKLLETEWLNTAAIRDNVKLHEFVIMPDHFHAIIEITFRKGNNKNQIGEFKFPSQTPGAIIRGFKAATTKRIKELANTLSQENSKSESQFAPTKIWQRNYHDHIVRSTVD